MPSPGVVVAPYHPFSVQVAAVTRLSPHFVRVSFTGADLEHFGVAGPDQRIKVLLPHADGSFAPLGQDDGAADWYELWRALPDHERNPFRTYTVRHVDATEHRVDVDFVVHEAAGPAGEWASAAATGQRLLLVGADLRADRQSGGFDWHPGSARRVLLAGDETAVPAILSILETLDDGVEVDAFLEVPSTQDRLTAAAIAGHRVHWLVRDGAEHGAALVSAVTQWADDSRGLLACAAAERRQSLPEIDVDRDLLWDSPDDADGEFYAWIAGESAVVKTLRRTLVTGHGVDRARVAFMGYWRLGQSERTE